MKKITFIGITIALSVAAMMVTETIHAQYRRYGGNPRVSIGIGGLFGFGRWGGFYGNGRAGVSIVLPPIIFGARIQVLPPGFRKIYFGGTLYYYRGNTYYREMGNGDGYESVEPPLGATINRLPLGTKRITINGQIFYEYSGNYYMQDNDNTNSRSYILVGTKGQLNIDEALRLRDESRNENDDAEYNDRNYNDDNFYNNGQNNNEPSANNGAYGAGPQIGDRFENLPRNTRTITVGGKTQYESPAGTRYQAVIEDGKTVYEVVKIK
jgi:hypothetical protein